MDINKELKEWVGYCCRQFKTDFLKERYENGKN